jgi:hypothetical protein
MAWRVAEPGTEIAQGGQTMALWEDFGMGPGDNKLAAGDVLIDLDQVLGWSWKREWLVVDFGGEEGGTAMAFKGATAAAIEAALERLHPDDDEGIAT